MKILPVPEEQLSELLQLYNEYDRPNFPTPPDGFTILKQIRSQNGEVFVAIDEAGVLCGTYSIIICANLNHGGEPFAVIENVIVTRLRRRTGLGRMLMAHARENAIKHGCYKLLLQSGAYQTGNHQFYESCGFANEKCGFQIRLN